MKKTLALILAAVMALSLVACAKTPANGGTEAKGSVYYLNFKPEADKAWQDLAKTYTERTCPARRSRSSPPPPASMTPC